MSCSACAEQTACPVSVSSRPHIRRVALAGNPNVGKSSVFNLLTGVRQRTGNYAGVTVERKIGRISRTTPIEVIDLPGLYSLDADSLDERIAADVLKGVRHHERAPDLVACVVDATNLERNLLLATQIIELGIPTIIVLNMMDVAERDGTAPDSRLLSRELGVPVVPISARRREGIERLSSYLNSPLPEPSDRRFPSDIVVRLEHISRIVAKTQRAVDSTALSVTDRFDGVLTHRVAGPLIFLGILFVVFQAIFSWATPMMDLIEVGVGALAVFARHSLPPGLATDLLTDGVIAGVGAVLVFLPQILLLFLFVGFLEDTGYMARAAFISDRLMHRLGLSGQSVIPLVSGYACAVPAIMATRSIPSHRDRLVTMMVIPLMSCSARLPIYTLLIGALIPAALGFGPIGAQGMVLFLLYMLSTGLALVAAAVLKNRVFCGSTNLMAMELPPYRLPQLRNIGYRMGERSWMFVSQAGRVILLMTIVLWFLAAFPRMEMPTANVDGSFARPASVEMDVEVDLASMQIRQSYVGRIGRVIEPVMRPLGFDWKMSAGIITAFAARETLISTLATLYSVGDDTGGSLTERLRADRWPDTGKAVFTPLVAVSLMIFFMIACQCMSTLAIIRRETGTWRWPVIAWVYMTGLAYVASLIIYQGGVLLGLG